MKVIDMIIRQQEAKSRWKIWRLPSSLSPHWDSTTPWKINMEPTSHPFRKEHDLPNLHDYVPSSGVYWKLMGFGDADDKWLTDALELYTPHPTVTKDGL